MKTSIIHSNRVWSAVQKCIKGNIIPLGSKPSIGNMVDRLCYVNYRQWQLEDAARDSTLSAEKALELLRAIQSSNAERNKLWDLIDKAYLRRQRATLGAAGEQELECHETLGQLLDTLSVLYIRKYYIECQIALGVKIHPINKYTFSDAASAIAGQIALVERIFAKVEKLYLIGRVTLPLLNRFKLYAADLRNHVERRKQ